MSHGLVNKVQGKIKKRGLKPTSDTPAVRKWWVLAAAPAWVLTSFAGGYAAVYLVFLVIRLVGINTASLGAPAVIQSIASALIYVFSILIAIGLPYVILKNKTTRRTLGLSRLMSWSDIGLAPLGFIAYLLLSVAIGAIAIKLFPGYAPSEVQDVGFSNLSNRTGYLLAFITLVVIAPIAEETLFRGYLYGKLRGHVPIWAAMIATSILFGAVHGQWNLALDTFALSIVMCSLREITGSIWAGILLHMLKNFVAFYVLFIAPMLPA